MMGGITRTRSQHRHGGQLGWADRGERYVVSYCDGKGIRHDYGFTNDEAEAREWVKKIAKNKLWSNARIRERKGKA